MSLKKPNAILIGDDTNALYHPLKGPDAILSELLSDTFDVTCTEDRTLLEASSLSNFNLCIAYFDSWEKQLDPRFVAGILSFVAMGGGFLVVHNGISYQDNPEFAQLVGAKFTGHPPYQMLKYKIERQHPITEGIQDFEMDEELYQFDFDSFSDLTLLIRCSNQDTSSPAAWVRQYGLGRMAYLAPGHNMKSFQKPEFQKLIKRSALWTTGLL